MKMDLLLAMDLLIVVSLRLSKRVRQRTPAVSQSYQRHRLGWIRLLNWQTAALKAHVLILRHECLRKLTEHPETGSATAAPIALMAYIQDVSDLSLPEAQVAEMGRQSSLSKLRKEVCLRLGGKRISALWKVRYSCQRVELCNVRRTHLSASSYYSLP